MSSKKMKNMNVKIHINLQNECAFDTSDLEIFS